MPEYFASRIKNYNRERGFGFIKGSRSFGDLFFHVTAIRPDSRLKPEGERAPARGDRVVFALGKRWNQKSRVEDTCAEELCLLEEVTPDFLGEENFRQLMDSDKVAEEYKAALCSKIGDWLLYDHPEWMKYADAERVSRLTENADSALLARLIEADMIHWKIYLLRWESCDARAADDFLLTHPGYEAELCSMIGDRLPYDHPEWMKYADAERVSRLTENADSALLARLCEADVDYWKIYDARWENCNARAADDFLLARPELLTKLSDDRIRRLIRRVDWQNTDPAYVQAHAVFFGTVEADAARALGACVAISMVEADAALSLPWWKLFTDSVKARILIHCSNFPERLEDWRERLREVYRYELDRHGNLLLALMDYVGVAVAADEAKKRDRFRSADERLYGYVVDCFEDGLDVTPALDVVLEHCQDSGNQRARYYCDGKAWGNKNGVYCPTTTAMEHHVKGLCPYLGELSEEGLSVIERRGWEEDPGKDWTDGVNKLTPFSPQGVEFLSTAYRKQQAAPDEARCRGKVDCANCDHSAFEQQRLTDMLLNLGVEPFTGLYDSGHKSSWRSPRPQKPGTPFRNCFPDLLSQKAPWQYAFRVSGFVNRQIDMKEHMWCRCGKSLEPIARESENSTTVNSTMFRCSQLSREPGADPEQHDDQVYLNFCYRCHRVIDSRECRQHDGRNLWLCMYCGGSPNQEPGKVCPNCADAESNPVTSVTYDKGRMFITCKACGHDGASMNWRFVVPDKG